ncbi:MAG: PAS domain S-box protein [Pseudomonadales bacterium]|nr:PAS domain S-box protein [Pseudomonadales bacterium]
MNFSVAELSLVGATYLLTLFLIAYATEKGIIPHRISRHPSIYILSLGVYCSAWAVYGSVGFAYENGYNFLSYYLGIAGAFLIAPITLAPFLRLAHTYKLNSLPDLFAFRYRSKLAGASAAFFLTLGLIPLLALQIQAVAQSVSLLNNSLNENTIALAFCILIMLFTSMYGGHSKGGRSKKHEGLVAAIAFETIVKVIVMLIVGAYAVFSVFDGPQDLQNWLDSNPAALEMLYEPLDNGPWRSLILTFFAAAIVMPHMYQMTFTESTNPRSLLPASWGFPLILFLIALCIPPILWAGIKLQTPGPPEYYTLAITLAGDSRLTPLIAFVGGLSASSGIIIVVTLALSEMCLNHLAIPMYKPSMGRFSIGWVKFSKRLLMAAIILASFGFYVALENRLDLSQLGTISYTATLNFVPGILGLLFWNKANRQGVISGLAVGFVLWLIHFFWPAATHTQASTTLAITLADIFDEDIVYMGGFIVIAGNAITFIVVSLLTRTSEEEQRAAEICALDTRQQSSQWELSVSSASDFTPCLTPQIGALMAQREVEQALSELKLDPDEQRAYALIRLRDRVETNLSSFLGPSIAQDIMDQTIPYKQKSESGKSEDIHRMESRMEAYRHKLSGLAAELDSLRRFHRQTLEDLPIGMFSISEDEKIQAWNKAMEALTGHSSEQLIGMRINSMKQPWKTFLIDFIRGESDYSPQATINIDEKTLELSLHKAAIGKQNAAETSSQVIVVEDLTELRLLESELTHSERLASIGRLAAGVAHEVGNPVTGIACLAQNIQYDTENKDLLDTADQILEQTNRITRIVQSLVNFSHSGEVSHAEHCPVNMHECVTEAIDLLRLGASGKSYDYHNDLPDNLQVMGDAQRLLQVFVNLLGNAQDASSHASKINIYSEGDSHSVIIHVEDEGEGIPDALQDQIFEPFVTTKDPGEGTGLGLSLVYSIIEDHYGHISVTSPVNPETGKGNRFSITLPASEQLNLP